MPVAANHNDLAAGLVAVQTAMGARLAYLTRKNRVINGCFRLAQRAMPTTDDQYCLDRWVLLLEAANAATVSQETSDVPTDGSKYGLKRLAPGAVDRKAGGLGSSFKMMGSAAAAGFVAVSAAAVGAGVALYNIGSQFDSAYDKIRVNTGATGEALGSLQQSFRNVVRTVPADFDTASTAIAGLNQRLGLTGQPLEAVSRRMLELGRIDVAPRLDDDVFLPAHYVKGRALMIYWSFAGEGDQAGGGFGGTRWSRLSCWCHV